MEKKRNPFQKNQQVQLEITAVTSEGQGLGRADGVAIFVPNTAPGETVLAHIVKVEKNFCIAKAIEILKPSAARVAPRCVAYRLCGGCTMQHLSYAEQLNCKREFVQDAFERIGGFEDVSVLPVLGMENPWRYRNKGAFPLGNIDGAVSFGFFAQRSHRLIPLFDCPIQDERVVRVAAAVTEWANLHRISVYNEETKRGVLRTVMARITQSGGLMAVVVTTAKLPHERELIASLDFVDSLYHNVNGKDTNVIFGSEFRLLSGSPSLLEDQDGLQFSVSPQSFLQVNPQQTAVLYDAAVRLLNPQKSETVLDLYCGIGTISLKLARYAKSVIGIESVPEAIEDAKRNAERNGIRNAAFYAGLCEEVLPKLLHDGVRPDCIMLDPPRKGCEPQVLNAIKNSKVERLVYVSCNPSTLARDAAILKTYGYYPSTIQPVDMFPHTHHVETVVCFSREKYAGGDETMLCDMHTHSNCSDGSFSPEELIEEAKKEGIAAIALCDHNTVSGLTRFINAAKESGVIAVPGVEITSAYKGKEVHILGLFLKECHYQKIANYLEQINIRKIESNKLLAKRLNEGGYVISYDAVLKIAGKAIPNRVHFAKALFAKGYVSSVAEAFDTILAEDGEFYKPAKKLDSLEVIRFLQAVDAVTVLAHPFLNFSKTELCEFLQKAKQYGLVGMETIYPLFSKEDSALAQEIAKEFALIASGGTDFHGINKPDIKLGRGKHNIFVPYEVYENLRRASRFPPKQITDESVVCLSRERPTIIERNRK